MQEDGVRELATLDGLCVRCAMSSIGCARRGVAAVKVEQEVFAAAAKLLVEC